MEFVVSLSCPSLSGLVAPQSTAHGAEGQLSPPVEGERGTWRGSLSLEREEELSGVGRRGDHGWRRGGVRIREADARQAEVPESGAESTSSAEQDSGAEGCRAAERTRSSGGAAPGSAAAGSSAWASNGEEWETRPGPVAEGSGEPGQGQPRLGTGSSA